MQSIGHELKVLLLSTKYWVDLTRFWEHQTFTGPRQTLHVPYVGLKQHAHLPSAEGFYPPK